MHYSQFRKLTQSGEGSPTHPSINKKKKKKSTLWVFLLAATFGLSAESRSNWSSSSKVRPFELFFSNFTESFVFFLLEFVLFSHVGVFVFGLTFGFVFLCWKGEGGLL